MVRIDDNTGKFKDAMQEAINDILRRIGGRMERYAKARCPVGTEESTGIKGYIGGTLRNSITHRVDSDGGTVEVGSNVVYAP